LEAIIQIMRHIASWHIGLRENKADVGMHRPRIVFGLTLHRSVIVQQLIDEQKANPEMSKVAYFYCNASEQQRTKTQEILGAIARQLSFNGFDKPPESAFLDAYNGRKKDADDNDSDQIERLSIKGLTELIPKVVGDRTATILIDALDECAERLDLLKALRTIMDKAASVKVIISGRSEVCQDMPKDEFPVHISIGQGENKDDIRKYVTSEVDRAISNRRLLRGKVSDQLKETIVQKLNDSAQGMYVYGRSRCSCADRLARLICPGYTVASHYASRSKILIDRVPLKRGLWLGILKICNASCLLTEILER
jgi:hypothetical protein